MKNQLKKSNKEALINYLNSRKLKPFDKAFYFTSPIVINDKIIDKLVIISTNLNRVDPVITKIDYRTNDKWNIAYNNPNFI